MSRKVVAMIICSFSLGTLLGLLVHTPGVMYPDDSSDRVYGARSRGALYAKSRYDGQLIVLNNPRIIVDILAPARDAKVLNKSKLVHRNVETYREKMKRIFTRKSVINMDRLYKSKLRLKTFKDHVNFEKRKKILSETVKSNYISFIKRIGKSKIDDHNAIVNEQTTDSSSVKTSVVDSILWNQAFVDTCSRGFSTADTRAWIHNTGTAIVTEMAEGCGRMQNRLLTFADGSKACARYRQNDDQIQGEIYSYHLGELLQLNNNPPTILALVNTSSVSWYSVRDDIATSGWTNNKLVVLTEYVTPLQEVYIPHEFRKVHRNDSAFVHVVDADYVHTFAASNPDNGDHLCDLYQWSSLIVYDYLTANLDRVVNNMHNEQWNRDVMNQPAHNLMRYNSSLVYLDNESGLFHGYRLLDKYGHYHESLLRSVCVFSPSLFEAVKNLSTKQSAATRLQTTFVNKEKYHDFLLKIPQKNLKILQKRIDLVYTHMMSCYKNNP